MVLGLLNDPACQVLAAAMDACALRNKTIASNVANADTPGYKRAYVQFEDALKEMLATGRDISQEPALASVAADNSPSQRPDGNNVNVDVEMAELARTTIEYNALVELQKLKSGLLSTAINGGSR